MSNLFALPSYLKTATVVAVFALASYAQQGFAAGVPAPNTLPTGGKVVAGSAAISQAGNTMNINQSSQRAVVNWNSFDVGSKATVNFNQPNAQAATLNYVNSATKSMINGAVNANGQVIFVNNNGVVFGKGAEVNVGGMVATTMNTSAADFMAGKNVQTYEGGGNGKVINRGTITGNNANSYIALMAPQVKNTGVITAAMSGANAVALVAGEKVNLTFSGSQLVSVSVDASVVNALIKNKLLIQAGSGQVIIAANSAQDLMGSVIKNTGTISATGISTAGGKISLTGDTVEQAGTIAANSSANDGGQVAIQGNNITLKAGSKTTAIGASAGGSINVGVNTATAISNSANSQSIANAIQNNQLAKTVSVQENALVDASATQNGNGGSINIWSQVKTFVAGNLVAKGGAQGGNGGAIETSSKGQVQLGQGLTVDTSTPKGKTGLWVVDPTSIIVDSNAASLIANALNTTSVTLDATGNVCASFGSCSQSQTALIQFVTGANILATNPNTSLNLIANGGLIEINSNIQVGALNAMAEVININQGSSINTLGGSSGNVFLAGATINFLGSINTSGSTGSGAGSSNASGSAGNTRRRNGVNSGINADSNIYTSNGNNITIIATGDINIGNQNIQNNSNTSLVANGLNGGIINIVSKNGNVINNGTIDAVGLNGNGGQIIIAGQNSTVMNNALISADGLIGGGLIQIGLANNIGSGSTLAPPVIQNPFAIYFSTGSPAQNNINSVAAAFNVISQATSLDSNSGISASAVNNTNSQNSITTGGQIILVGNNTLDTAAQIQANGGNGGLILLSSPTGTYQNTGYIQTNGGAGLGGTIAQSGLISTNLTGATLEANGQLGGGNITAGRDFQTSPLPGSVAQSALLPDFSSILTLPTSQATNIDQNSTLSANAIQNGNGGNILNWGEVLNAYGAFNARGGALGGNGGLVETSGANDVVVTGFSVNTRAPNGKAGTWLLDPTNAQPSALTQAAFQTVLDAGNNAVYSSSTNINNFPGMTLHSPSGFLDVTFTTVGTAKINVSLVSAGTIVDNSTVAGAGLNFNIFTSGGGINTSLGTISVKGSITLDNTYGGTGGPGGTASSGYLLVPANVSSSTVGTGNVNYGNLTAGKAVTINAVSTADSALFSSGSILASQQTPAQQINLAMYDSFNTAWNVSGGSSASPITLTSGTALIAGGDINVQANTVGRASWGQGYLDIVANGANVNLGTAASPITSTTGGFGVASNTSIPRNITATTMAGVGGNVKIYAVATSSGSALDNRNGTITADANVVISAQNTNAASGSSAAVNYVGLIKSNNGSIDITGTTAGTLAVSIGSMTISGGSGDLSVTGNLAAAGGSRGITQVGAITDNSNGGNISFTSNGVINQAGNISLIANNSGSTSSVTYDTTAGNALSTILSGSLLLTGGSSASAINYIETSNGAPITTSVISVPGYILIDNTNNGATLAANATTGTAITIGGSLNSGAHAGTNAITLKAITGTGGIGINDNAATNNLTAIVGNVTLNSTTTTGAGITYDSPITATSGTVNISATSTTGVAITATGAITGLGITVNGTATTATTITSLGAMTVNGLYVVGTNTAPSFIGATTTIYNGTYIGSLNSSSLPVLSSGSLGGSVISTGTTTQAATVVYGMSTNTATNAEYLLGWGQSSTVFQLANINIRLIGTQVVATVTAAKTNTQSTATTLTSSNILSFWNGSAAGGTGTLTSRTPVNSLSGAGIGIANIAFSGSPTFINAASGDIVVTATGTAGSNTGITQTGAIVQNVNGGDISFTSNNKINQTGNIALAPNTSGTPSSITYDTTTGTLGSSIVAGALTLTGGVTASTTAINYIEKASGASLSIAATSVPGFILVDNTYGGTGGPGGTPTSGYLNSGTVTSSNTSALTGIAITGALSAGTYVTLNGVSSGSASTAPGISFGGNINSSALSSGYGININGYASGSALNTSVAVALTTGSTLIAGGDINVLAYSNGNTIYTSGGLYSFSTYGGNINIGTSANPIYAGGVAINGYNNDTFTSVVARTVGGIGGAINIYAQNIDPTNGAAYIGGVLTADANIIINASNTAVGSAATALLLGTNRAPHTITSNNGSVTIQGTVLGSGAGVNSVSSISAATNVSITGSQLGAGNGGGVIDTGTITALNGSVTITGTAKTTTAVSATGLITGNSITVNGTDSGTATTVVSLGAMTINACSSACASRDIAVTATNGVAGGNTGITQTGAITDGAVASNISFTSNNKIAQAGAISLVANTAASTPATVTYNTTSGNQLSTISTGGLTIGSGTNNSAINFVEKSNGSALTIAATTMPGFILVDNTCSACGTPLTPATAAASLTTSVGVTVSGALSASNYISIAGINTSATNAAVALGTSSLTVTNAASFPTAGVNAISVIGYKNSSTTSTVGSPGISSTGAIAVQSNGGDVLFQSNGDITQTGGLTLAANSTGHAQAVTYDTTSGSNSSNITFAAITSLGAASASPINLVVKSHGEVLQSGAITQSGAGPLNVILQSFDSANTADSNIQIKYNIITKGGYILIDGTGGSITGTTITPGSIANGIVNMNLATGITFNTTSNNSTTVSSTNQGGDIFIAASGNTNVTTQGLATVAPIEITSAIPIYSGGKFTILTSTSGSVSYAYVVGAWNTTSPITSYGDLSITATNASNSITAGRGAINITSALTSVNGAINLINTSTVAGAAGSYGIYVGAALSGLTGATINSTTVGSNVAIGASASGTITASSGPVNITGNSVTGIAITDSAAITGNSITVVGTSSGTPTTTSTAGNVNLGILTTNVCTVGCTNNNISVTSNEGTAGGGYGITQTGNVTQNANGGSIYFISNNQISQAGNISIVQNTSGTDSVISYNTTNGNKLSTINAGAVTFLGTSSSHINYNNIASGAPIIINSALSVPGSITFDNTYLAGVQGGINASNAWQYGTTAASGIAMTCATTAACGSLSANYGIYLRGVVGASTSSANQLFDAVSINAVAALSIQTTGTFSAGTDAINIVGITPQFVVTTNATPTSTVKGNAIGISGLVTISNNSTSGNTNIVAYNGRYSDAVTITNASTAGALELSAIGTTADIVTIAGTTFNQNSNAGVFIATSNNGNVTPPKINNNGTGPVVIEAGAYFAVGTVNSACSSTDCGQITAISGNSITSANGNVYLYAGSPGTTAVSTTTQTTLAYLAPTLGTLTFNNTLFGQAYAAGNIAATSLPITTLAGLNTANVAAGTGFSSFTTTAANGPVIQFRIQPTVVANLSGNITKVYGTNDPLATSGNLATVGSLDYQINTLFVKNSTINPGYLANNTGGCVNEPSGCMKVTVNGLNFMLGMDSFINSLQALPPTPRASYGTLAGEQVNGTSATSYASSYAYSLTSNHGTLVSSGISVGLNPATGTVGLVITPVALTITANNVTTSTGVNPALTTTVAGLVNTVVDGVTISDGINATPSLTLSADINTPGVYTGGCSPACPSGTTTPSTINSGIKLAASTSTGAGNYTITYVPGTLTASTSAVVTITLLADSKVYGNTATTANGLTYNNSGILNLTGLSLGNVTSASCGCTISGLPTGDTLTGLTLTSLGGILNAGVGAGSSAGGTYVITPSAAAVTGPNTNIIWQYVTNLMTVTPRPVTVTANAVNSTYGSAATISQAAGPSGGYQVATPTSTSGLITGDAITSVVVNYNDGSTNSTTVPGNLNATTYSNAIVASSASGTGGFNATNYNITYTPANLIVAPLAVTLTAVPQTTTYGTALALGTTSYTSSIPVLPNGDVISGATLGGSCSGCSTGTVAGTTAAGSYTITPSSPVFSSGSSSNYAFTYNTGALTVDPAVVTIAPVDLSAAGQSVVYNGAAQTFNASTGFTVSGLQNGQTLQFGTTGLASGTNVGNYVNSITTTGPNSIVTGITGAGASLNNYTFNLSSQGSLTITPAALTVTGSTTNTAYNGTSQSNSAPAIVGLVGQDLVSGNGISVTGIASATNAGTYVDALAVSAVGSTQLTNYTLSKTNGVLTIDRLAATITGAITVNPYTSALQTNTYSTSGILAGDLASSSAIAISGAAAATHVSQGTVPDAFSVGGTSAGNYNFTSTPGSITITPVALAVTGANTTQVYNATIQTNIAATVTGLQGSDIATIGGSYGAGKNVGSYSDALTVSLSNPSDYTVGVINGSISITPATITIGGITANNKVYDATTAATLNLGTISYSGVYAGDTVSVNASNLTGAFVDKNVGTAKTVNISGVVLGGSSSSNYQLSGGANTTTTANITPAPLSITGSSATTTYNGATQALASPTVSGVIAGDNVLVSTTGGAGTNAGNYSTSYAASGTDVANYIITANTPTLTINKASLVVGADNNGKVVTQADPSPLTATVSGLQGSDTSSGVFVAPYGNYSVSRAAGESAGSYAITASGPAALQNYNVTYTPGTFTIVPAGQLLISMNAASTTYGTAASPTIASVQYGTSGGSVLHVLTVASQSGDAITYTDGASGYITITPSISGASVASNVGSYLLATTNSNTGITNSAGNFTSVLTVANTLTITPAPLTLTIADVSKTYNANAVTAAQIGAGSLTGGVIGGATVTGGSLMNSETIAGLGGITYTGSAIGAINASGSTYAINGSVGSGFSNYAVTVNSGALTINTAPLVVNGALTNKTYDGAVQTNAAATIAGLQGSDTMTVAGYATGTHVGTTSDSLVASGAAASNYSITYNNGSLTIGAAPLLVTGAANQYAYNGALQTNTGASVSGLKGSDTASVAGYATATHVAQGIVPDALVATLSNPTDYTVNYVQGSLQITPIVITAAVNSATVMYNANSQTTGFVVTGLKGSDTATAASGTATGTNVGSYTSNLVLNTSSDYTVGTITNGTLTINPAPLTISSGLTANSKVYDTTNAATIAVTGTQALAGVLGTDAITVSSSGPYTGATFSQSNVGSGLAVTPATTSTTINGVAYSTMAGVTLGGAQAGNYYVSGVGPQSLTANITPAPLTISSGLIASNKAYDGTTAASITTATQALAGVLTADFGNVSVSSSGPYVGTFSQSNVGTALTVSATTTPTTIAGATYNAMSGVTLSGSALGNYYVTGISAPLTANITPYVIDFGASSGPSITAVANNKVYTATTAANGSLAMVNLFGTDSVSVSYNNATFANPNAGSAIPVTFAGVTLSGPSAANYAIGNTPVTAAANISQALLTITAIDKASFYTQAITPLTNAYAPAVGLLGSDTVTGASVTTTATATSPVGSYPISIGAATGTGLGNYQINYVPATYTIAGPGALVISTDGVVTPYGTGTFGTLLAPALPTAIYTTGGQNISSLTYVSSSSSGAVTSYVFKDAANVNVTFDLSPSNTSTSTSGNVNVGSYAYATSNLSAGSTGLTSATPSGNYTVIPLALTIAATPTTTVYNGSTQNQSSATISPAVQSTVTGTDVVTVSGVASGRNAGIYGSNLVASGVDVSNYSITLLNANLTISPYELGSGGAGTPALTATANNKVYDATAAASGSIAISNLFSTDVVTASYTNAAFTGITGANVNNGTTVTFNGVTLSGADAANYVVGTSPVTSSANITPAPLTISAGLTANNKVYDTTNAATIGVTGAQSLAGVLGADIVSVNSSGPYTGATFSQSNVGTGLVVTPATSVVNGLTTMTGVTLTGAAAGNYYVTGVGPQTLTANITPAPLTISSGLTANDKAYDATTAATISSGTQVLSGLVGSDINTSNVIVSSSGSYAATFASPNVANGITVTANTTPTMIAGGTYNAMSGATLSGISAGNYYVTGASSPISANITPYIINFGSGGTGPNINAVANNKVYTSTDTASGALSMVNLFAGDSVAVSFASATFASANVANGTTVTFNTPVLSGASAGNYQIGSTAITATANITPAPLTVTAVNKSSFYSQALASLTIAPAVGLLGSDTVAGATLATTADTTGVNASAGTYPISVSLATGSGISNYAITYVPATYTIVSPGQLQITTSGVTTVYGTGTSGNIIAPAQPVASYSTGGSNISALTFVSAATNGNVISYVYRDATNALVSFNLTPTGTVSSTSGNIKVGNYAYAVSGLVSASSGLTSNSAIANGSLTVTPLDITLTAPITGPLTYNGQVQTQGAAAASPAILTNDLVAISGLASGKNVGVYGSNLAVSGADVSNYNITLVNNNLTITPYVIGSVAGGPALTAAANDKVYNTTSAATGSLAMTNLFPGDSVAVNYASAAFASANVNTPSSPQTVTFNGVTLSGAAANNYALASTSTTASANITPAPITISGLVANNKVYTSTTAATISGTPIVTGLLGSDTSTVTGSAVGTFASPNVANNIAVTADLAGLTLGNNNYYITGVTAPLAANITPAPLSINSGLVATGKVYDTSATATIGVFGTQTLTGVLGSDATNLSVSSLGPYSGTFSQAGVGTSLAVTPATVSSLINGLSYTTMAGVTLSGIAAGNYFVSGPSATLTANITKAPLTIAANNQASFVTQPIGTLSYSSIGLLGSDSIAGVSLTTAATSAMPAANYAINAASATGPVMANYQISYVPGIYTIVPAGQLLVSSTGATTPYTAAANFANPTVAYATSGGAVINNLYLTASATVNGITTYTYSDGAGASLSFNFAPVNPALSGSNNLNVGTYGLSADNFQISGSNITNISPVVTGNLTVTPRPVTITAQAASYVYNGTNRTLPNTVSSPGIVTGDLVTVVDSLSNRNVGIYTSNLSTTGANVGNYQFTYANANLTITPYVIGSVAGGPALTAAANDKVYNTTSAATGSLAMTNLFPGDSVAVNYASAAFASANVNTPSSPQTVTFNGVTLSGAAANNYALASTSTTASANITPAPITISGLVANNKVYTSTTAATISGTPIVTGLLGSDTSTVTGSAVGTFASPNVANNIAVTADLAGLTLGNNNYYITGVTAPLAANITPAPLTISGLIALNKVYDGNLNALIAGTPSLVGLLGADTATLFGSITSGTFASANLGIDISVIANLRELLLSNSNYYITGVTTPLSADITLPPPIIVPSQNSPAINNMTIVQQQSALPQYVPASVMPTPPTYLQPYSDIKGETLYVRDREDIGSYIDAIPVPLSGSVKFPLPNRILQELIDMSGANHSASGQGYKYLLLTDGTTLDISNVDGGPLPDGVTYSSASRSFTVAKLSAVTLPITVKVSIKRGGALVSEKILEVTR